MGRAVAGFVSRSEAADERFEEKILYNLGPLAPSIHREYKRLKRHNRKLANEWLRKIGEYYRDAPNYLSRLRDLQAIEDKAKGLARKCIGDVDRVRNLLEAQGLELPPGDDDAASLERAKAWHYWNRLLKREASRWRDNLARTSGIVHKRRQIYCSDLTLEWQTECQTRNLDTMWKVEMTPDDPDMDVQRLSDFWERSLANPEVRRPEIMAHIRGDEDFAEFSNRYKGTDLRAVFVTMTLPSKSHARLERSGDQNPKYDGSSVRDGLAELQHTWSLIRSKFGRKTRDQDKIPLLGIRIAEPHHDGTPHAHFLLWIERSQRQAFMRTFRKYAMAVDGDEKGARKHRIKFEWIDKAKGSATAYVAKYIAKAIDGHKVDRDKYGVDGKQAASRIVAWARTHGARQFQRIGGPCVGPWREYRRLDKMPAPPHHSAWVYASAPGELKADWCGYMRAMGGANPGRDQPTRIVRDIQTSEFTGQTTPPTNCYGEKIEGSKLPVIGVVREEMFIRTRFTMWTAKFVGEKSASEQKEGEDFLAKNEIFGPWTRDNNCTRGPPMTAKNDSPTVNPFLEDLECLEERIEETVNDETPGAKARTEELFADMLVWMKMAAEHIPS